MPGEATNSGPHVLDLSDAEWRKSGYSADTGGDCVEVAVVDGHIAVRDSKHPSGPALAFTPSEWAASLLASATASSTSAHYDIMPKL